MSAVTAGGGGTAARRAAKQAADAKGRRGTKRPVPAERAEPTEQDVAPAGAPSRRQLDPDALADLEEQRAFLLASLRDLEAEHAAGDVDDVDYQALEDDYTARAAAVIRAIETRQVQLAEVASTRRRSPMRIAAVAVGVVVIAIVAGVLMAQASGRRNPGDSVSGDIRQDTRNLLTQAQSQFGSGQTLDAIKTYDQVLEIQPANAEALTYEGWLLYRVAAGGDTGNGQVSQADIDALKQRSQQALDDAVRADPAYPDAHIFRAIIARDAGRSADAAAELARVKPEQVPQLMRDSVEKLRAEVAGSS